MHDVIIVGSGAGGSAAAYVLAKAGLDVLLLERGNELPRDGSTLDVQRVFGAGEFLAREQWIDRRGNPLLPQERFNLGGKTKWYGAALLRFGPHEFGPDPAHECRGWPIGYAELAPYYDLAEKLLGVRTFPIEPQLQRLSTRLTQRNADWRAQPLNLGLAEAILDHPQEARRFDGFASPRGLKSDAETGLLAGVRGRRNLKIVTGVRVTDLVSAPFNARAIDGVRTASGETFRARVVLLAAGALHSPRLLRGYVEAAGLASQLTCSEAIGRHYKFHVLTAMLAFSLDRKTDALCKTTLFSNAAMPHSSVQPLGHIDAELFCAEAPPLLPAPLARFIGERVYGLFLQTEDGSHRDNRVSGAPDARPVLDYDIARLPGARNEHARLVRTLQRDLLRSGYLPLTKSIGLEGSAHACGTLAAGDDPADSVVDAEGRVHGMHNLYVVDGSVLPRSSRVNPALTIYAWSMRVCDRLARTDGLGSLYSLRQQRPEQRSKNDEPADQLEQAAAAHPLRA